MESHADAQQRPALAMAEGLLLTGNWMQFPKWILVSFTQDEL